MSYFEVMPRIPELPPDIATPCLTRGPTGEWASWHAHGIHGFFGCHLHDNLMKLLMSAAAHRPTAVLRVRGREENQADIRVFDTIISKLNYHGKEIQLNERR